MNKDKVKEAIEQFKHWRDYIKNNKEKVNKADDLIEYFDIILTYIKSLEQELDYNKGE